jgi:hypothetical protein
MISGRRFCLCVCYAVTFPVLTSLRALTALFLRLQVFGDVTLFEVLHEESLDWLALEDEGITFFRNVGNQRNSSKSIKWQHYLGIGLAPGTEHNRKIRKGGAVPP